MRRIAPWTPDEVVALDRYQRDGSVHPYTCPNRGGSDHRDMGGDRGALLPTVRGWVCPFCSYTQNWAHEFTTVTILVHAPGSRGET